MRTRLLALAAVVGAAISCSTNSAPPAGMTNTSASATAAAPASTGTASDPLVIAADLPRLPDGVRNAARPFTLVKAAYEFAARHPEVSGYMPCFCGCERGGHKSNESCFIASRRNGAITWETHAIGCEICLDVAIETMQMYNSGAKVADIRKLIEAKYAGLYPGHTPTPAPPGSKSGSH